MNISVFSKVMLYVLFLYLSLVMKILVLSVFYILAREVTLNCVSPSEKESTLKRKNLLLGSKFFLFRVDSFSEGFGVQKSRRYEAYNVCKLLVCRKVNRRSQKLSPL